MIQAHSERYFVRHFCFMTLSLVAADSQPLLPVTQAKRSSSPADFAQQIQKKIKVRPFNKMKEHLKLHSQLL